jgi:filamentous hemagglutinin family protein
MKFRTIGGRCGGIRGRAIVSVLGVASGLLATGVQAQQVRPDGTLNTTVTSPNGLDFTITNGTAAGPNLFHSFREFSIPTGGTAYFDNAATVKTIFSRVTGGSISSIDGAILANGTASVFLLNPNGILFGPNSSLSIGGSLIGTSANSIKFADGSEFSANLTTPPLLTMSVPIGLQFGLNPGPITNQSLNFTPGPQQTLALIGGDLLLQGVAPYNEVHFYVPDGHIELGSVGSNSLVSLASSPLGWAFDYSGVTAFRDITLAQNAFVVSDGTGGGTLQLQGNQIQISGGSGLYSLASGNLADGNITVKARGGLSIDGSSIFVNGSGRIDLAGDQIQISGGTYIENITSGDRPGGKLTLQARDGLSLGQNSRVISRTTTDAQGADIEVQAGHLNITEGSIIVSNTTGKGQGGNTTIRVTDAITLENSPSEFAPNGISVSTDQDGNAGRLSIQADRLKINNSSSIDSSTYAGIGNAGNVDIQVRQLQVTNGSYILLNTYSAGNAGSLSINATDSIEVGGYDQAGYGSGLFADGLSNSTGNGGSINLTTPNLLLRDNGLVRVYTEGGGNSGSVKVKAQQIDIHDLSEISAYSANTIRPTGPIGSLTIDADRLRLDQDSAITTESRGLGDANRLTINTKTLEVLNSSYITTKTRTAGQAGELTINATDAITLAGRSVNNGPSTISAGTQAAGQGGILNLFTGQLSLQDGAQIQAFTTGSGQAGEVRIKATDINLMGQSEISARSTASGAAGGVQIQADRLALGQQSTISANGKGQGGAGDLAITAGMIFLNDGSKLQADVVGQGEKIGNLTLNTDGLRLDQSSQILTTTSGLGDASRINISTRNLDLLNGSAIAANTVGQGNAGELTIRATDAITLAGKSSTGAASEISAGTQASGKGGTLNLFTGQLLLQDGAAIKAFTNGSGNAGTIAIQANQIDLNNHSQVTVASTTDAAAGGIQISTDRLALGQQSGISASGKGNGGAGDLIIQANTIALTEGSKLQADVAGGAPSNPTTPTGRVGNLSIQSNQLRLDQASQIFTTTSGLGDASRINISTGSLDILNGSAIAANTLGAGNAGELTIRATDALTLAGKSRAGGSSEISAGTQASGKGGAINLFTGNLLLQDGAGIKAFADGSGSAGTIAIQAQNINLNGQSQISVASSTAAAGGIEINTGQLALRQQSSISASGQGPGGAGNLTINATGAITLSGASKLQADVAGGSQGNINLNAQLLFLRGLSQISTNATGSATGGNMTFNLPFVIAFENSDITANANRGQGGKIQITTQGLIGTAFRPRLTPNSDITASSDFGLSGSVQISPIGIDPNTGLVSLPANLADASQQVVNRCGSNQTSRFVITGRGGVPTNPQSLRSDHPWQDLRHPPGTTAAAAPARIAAPPWVEASHWQRNSQTGAVELVAAVVPSVQNAATCATAATMP